MAGKQRISLESLDYVIISPTKVISLGTPVPYLATGVLSLPAPDSSN